EGRERLGEFGAKVTDPSIIAAVDRLRGMPVWLFHGALDGVVPADESRMLETGLRTVDADVRYTEYPDADHNAWDNAYGDPALAAWFAEHLD
ncbi:MAG: hypothetical protein AAGA55_11560, partial [Planctomycetota bacterium]